MSEIILYNSELDEDCYRVRLMLSLLKLDHTPGADEQLKKAADLMRSWDGKLTTDSVAA